MNLDDLAQARGFLVVSYLMEKVRVGGASLNRSPPPRVRVTECRPMMESNSIRDAGSNSGTLASTSGTRVASRDLCNRLVVCRCGLLASDCDASSMGDGREITKSPNCAGWITHVGHRERRGYSSASSAQFGARSSSHQPVWSRRCCCGEASLHCRQASRPNVAVNSADHYERAN